MVETREPERIQFNANAAPLEIFFFEDCLEVGRWVDTFLVVPDANIFDDGGATRLLQIRPAREEYDRLVVRRQHRALEENEAAGVKSSQVVVTLLCEDDQCGQI